MIGLPPQDRARVGDWMVRHLGPLCPPWLVMQRWFGGKARPVAGAAVADVIWMDAADPSVALVIVDVRYADHGDRGEAAERYALVAGVTRQISPATLAAIPGTPWVVNEVATQPDGAAAVLQALASGARLTGACGGVLVCEGGAATVADPADIRPIGEEQSNTSVRIGHRHVLKVVRRIQAGVHPQLEMGAFLTRAGFHWAPPLQGSLSYRDRGGNDHVVAILEGWIDNSGDGWRYVTSLLSRGATGAAFDGLLDALAHLGAITAELHVVLASDTSNPAFAPEPAGPADLSAWNEQLLREEARVLDIVAHDRTGWAEPAYDVSRAALGGRASLRRRILDLDLQAVGSEVGKVRVHGDYHLGQTLRSPEGFVLIDFEGEPARPLAERRRKHCALKDVAGMLRSLDYADASVRIARPSASSAVGPMRQAFLDGYYARPELRTILPARESSDALLTMFELEKVLYEIEYELNNRPDWLPIPLAALARIVSESP